jgi:hypothetical protein
MAVTISRRQLMSIATGGGVIALGGGTIGLLAVQRAVARNSLSNELIRQSAPILTSKADQELDALPNAAREKIRLYFDRVILHVHSFAAEICTELFAEQLAGCSTDEDKHRLLNVAFSRKVVTGVEVLNRVGTIAKETGAELDRNWDQCCSALSAKWTTAVSRHQPRAIACEVAAAVKPRIVEHLDNARRAAYPIGQRPALIYEVIELGESALLLLAVEEIAPEVFLPLFVVTALANIWRWFVDRLSNRAAELQNSVTEQLALLGNQVSDEFQKELRTRISDLHGFQEQSLAEAARREANDAIPSLW